jgi:hypothetical protein
MIFDSLQSAFSRNPSVTVRTRSVRDAQRARHRAKFVDDASQVLKNEIANPFQPLPIDAQISR